MGLDRSGLEILRLEGGTVAGGCGLYLRRTVPRPKAPACCPQEPGSHGGTGPGAPESVPRGGGQLAQLVLPRAAPTAGELPHLHTRAALGSVQAASRSTLTAISDLKLAAVDEKTWIHICLALTWCSRFSSGSADGDVAAVHGATAETQERKRGPAGKVRGAEQKGRKVPHTHTFGDGASGREAWYPSPLPPAPRSPCGAGTSSRELSG
ncbi:unnamed protein product [Rangifer tarandus platyrhynchus]|uniref:Uncharacterized protein n=2 Tax=Rangifer tarandus platyrhynchus TaxID=3082113 RepID=A0ACB0F2A1_RANTA|nr:unnamed protein product [Rangifer tarandus platyrhynchus]CAI9707017.1 unnamed protein product [Rangifer tarandus platyrhynchus]